MSETRVVTVTIDRPWKDVYETFWRPESFPEWASGLSGSNLTADGDRWTAEGPEGPVRIRFTPHNSFGVMDHWVELPDGHVVHIPLRIIANGKRAEVMLTLYRQPGMSDQRFADDEAWIRRDLKALKSLAEK